MSLPHHNLAAGELTAHYAPRMQQMEATELLAAAQAGRKAKLDAGRVDTAFKVETACAVDREAARCRRHW